MKPRVCATTWYDDAFAAMGDVCLAALARYCRRHDYELRMVEPARASRPAPWHKIEILRDLLETAEADHLFWVDADAVIVRPDAGIHEEIVDGKDLCLVRHPIGGREVPNTGVFLLRTSDWSRRLLAEMWSLEQYVEHHWWENAALLHVLGYHELLGEKGPSSPDPRWIEKVQWLDPKWNSLPGVVTSGHPIIKHYAGRPISTRIAAMRADARRSGLLRGASSPMATLKEWAYRLGLPVSLR